MTKKLLMLAIAAVLAVPAALHAQEEASWIHVRVDEEDGAKVRINLPISMVDVALETARKEGLDDAHMHWKGHGDMSIQDLRRMWQEMRDAGDAEFVNVQDGDEHVRVFRKGDRVYVQVDEEGDEKVRIEMPTEVADALLSGEGETLDVRAAVDKLARRGAHELVRVRDGAETVRIWVDNRNSQDEDGGT